MKLKTYTASTMAQALAQVRKELGADAMILHTRSYRTGSWLGLGGKPMVEITASSPQPSKSKKTRRVKRKASAVQRAQQIDQHIDQRVEESVPEIVVQRSRVPQPIAQPIAQPITQHTAQAASVETPVSHASPLDEPPVEDREALLQGLMGGADPVIQDRLTQDRLDRVRDFESISNRPDIQKRESSASTVHPPKSEDFQVATFKTVEEFDQDEKVEVDEQSVDGAGVVETRRADTTVDIGGDASESLLPPGNVPVFEMAMTPFEETIETPSESVEPEVSVSPKPVLADSVIEPVIEPVAKSDETQALQTQIETLQKMMGQVLDTTRRTAVAVNKTNPDAVFPLADMSAPLHALYTGMIDNDVPVDLADRFVGAVRDRLDADELGDASVVRHALLREIESSIQTVSDSLLTASSSGSGPGQRPRVLALIGPTGVGKTTTVAKLAATAKLRHGKRVALITSDTYRIAAVEQLKTYASIIGLELRIANSPEEMASLIASLHDVDLVVIDTAGRSQNNHARLDELGELIKSAQPDETHLVLSSTVGENVLCKTAERFMPLGPDRCILTKIDEAVTTGMIAGMGDRIGLPLSFVTVGQEVPEDILSARADRLARAVLDGPAAVVPGMGTEMASEM